MWQLVGGMIDKNGQANHRRGWWMERKIGANAVSRYRADVVFSLSNHDPCEIDSIVWTIVYFGAKSVVSQRFLTVF